MFRLSTTRLARLITVCSLLLTTMLTTAGDWPTYLHDVQRTSANQTETSLSPANAPRLAKLWTFKTGGFIAASPTVVSNTVYAGSWDGYEYALNAATGALIWKQFLGITTSTKPDCIPSYGITSSPTVQNGVVYVGGGDAYWYALDATTGAVLWKVFTGDNSADGGHYNWSSPLIYNGYAYIGISSLCDDPLVQGQLLQVDLNTHKVVNTLNVVPGGQVGGGIWTTPSVDVSTNTIYVTTGNEGQEPASSQPLARSMVALDATTLAVKGSWQAPDAPGLDDEDWSTTPTLFSDSAGDALVAAADKAGYVYAFDRSDISAGPLWQNSIATGGDCPECGDGTASSGAFGQGLLFAAGGNGIINSVPVSGSIRALDPATGVFHWQYGTSRAVVAALAYANGLVVAGAGSTLTVLNAATGALLYSYQAATSFTGPPSIANGRLFTGGMDGTIYAFGAAAIAISPSPVRVGATLTITGTNFATTEPISLYLDSTSSRPLTTTLAGSDGSFTTRLSMPVAISGTHVLIGVGQSSSRWDGARFQVKPYLSLQPTGGAAGSTVTAIGSGFGSRETITLYWDTTAQAIGTGSSNTNGSMSTTLQIPAAPAGTHVVIAIGQRTRAQGANNFSVH
jgi:polyvinyl alcohol dehydrogenase (cytochrome)